MWPAVQGFTDHWTWRPDWTPERPRVLWYLTFQEEPHLRDAAAPWARPLAEAGADVVPSAWLHLTLSDVGFVDEVDDRALALSRQSVRHQLTATPPPRLTLGPLGILPGAVVLRAGPPRPLRRLRRLVRQATCDAGITPPEDFDGAYWPHVSLCYVNRHTDHDRLRELARRAPHRAFDVRAPRLTQVLVTRRDGHYRWEALGEVPLADRGQTWPASWAIRASSAAR